MNGPSRPDFPIDELRSRALTQLSQELAGSAPLTPDEASALVAELRTHQIEIELQNEELRRAQTELAASRDRFSDLYDFAPIGYVTVGANGLIVEANLTLAELLQVERGRIIGQRFGAFIHHDDEGIYYRYRKDTLAGGKRRTCRLRLQRTAAPEFWAELDSSPVTPPAGPETVIRLAVRDITDFQEIEAALNQAQRLEAIGTMAGGVAHNMNNILQAVIGFTRLAAHGLDADSPLRPDLDCALKAAHGGAKLVGQLLAFGRPEPSTTHTIDICDLVTDTAELLRGMIPPHTTIATDVDLACGTVAGNIGELQQVIFNLCTNARQALPGNCGEVRIGLREVDIPLPDGSLPGDLPGGRYVRLTVTDEGTGMTPETLQRACEPFFSTKPLFSGTGLGLFTTHGTVARHGGAMQITSQPGAGTEILVYLPCGRAAAIADQPQPAVVWGQTTKPRIMFVDDYSLVTLMMERQLNRLGFVVNAFMSGCLALEAFAADPSAFDLLITDQSMPIITGTRLAKEITAIRPGLPVILMSGLPDPIGKEESTELGIVMTLAKPVDILELEQAIFDTMRSVANPDS